MNSFRTHVGQPSRRGSTGCLKNRDSGSFNSVLSKSLHFFSFIGTAVALRRILLCAFSEIISFSLPFAEGAGEWLFDDRDDSDGFSFFIFVDGREFETACGLLVEAPGGVARSFFAGVASWRISSSSTMASFFLLPVTVLITDRSLSS